MLPVLQLSLLIEGPGTDVDKPSHWAFATHPSTLDRCTLFNVLTLDDNLPRERRVYGFDRRDGHKMFHNDSQGRILLASGLTGIQYQKVSDIIEAVPAPLNANKEGENCQHWVVNVLVDLEVEELIEAGLSEWMGELVGKSAEAVKAEAGEKEAWFDAPEDATDKVFVHKFLS